MTTFALVLSVLSFVGLIACFALMMSLMKTLGGLSKNLDKLSTSVEKMEKGLEVQRAAVQALEAKLNRKSVITPASLTDGLVHGLVGGLTNKGLPTTFVPIAAFVLRGIVGYLGKRAGTTIKSRKVLARKEANE